MNTFKTFLILTIAALFFGTVSHASFNQPYRGSFASPIVAVPGDNHEWEPINIGPLNQDKADGLSVTTFFARGDAVLQQAAIFSGLIRGGTVIDPSADSILHFGDIGVGSIVDITTTSKVGVEKNFQSDTLIATAPNLGPYLCADTDGTLILCRDRCSNFPGMQPSLPAGWIDNGSGGCVQDDVILTNPGTTCAYTMKVTKTGDRTADFDLLNSNGTPYVYNDPASPTSNMHVQLQVLINPGSNLLPTQNFLVPHGHVNDQDIVSVQDTTMPSVHYIPQSATVVGVQPSTINGGEVCWVGF